MQTTTGTLNASAIERCSLDIPIRPAFAPTIRMTQLGAPEVSPYNVVFRYRSCPAKSRDYELNFLSIIKLDEARFTNEGDNLCSLI
jgi:hypothetical protein